MDIAQQVMSRLDELGRISEEPGCLTRMFASPAMQRANTLVRSWMSEAGMATSLDAVGNLVGTIPGTIPHARTLLLGSHLDTVRNAGKYDGPLGVVIAIACVEQLRSRGWKFPFPIQIVGFADEEGARYQTAYLGSRALTGDLTAADLELRDAEGIRMADAIRAFGGNPDQLKQSRLNPEELLGYAEIHIEQGPVLEQRDQSIAVVSAIAGQFRIKLSFQGRPGHAGTTPMNLRADALCAAAEFIGTVENYTRQSAGLVATVGQLNVDPNISNVIPGKCQLSLDVRHQTDATRVSAVEELNQLASEIAAARGVSMDWQLVQETASVPCSPALTQLLRQAAERHQPNLLELPSGAGHDAAVISRIAPVAMLFVRCAGGVSHHPDETVRVEDVRVALEVLTEFVASLANLP